MDCAGKEKVRLKREICRHFDRSNSLIQPILSNLAAKYMSVYVYAIRRKDTWI